MPPRPKSKAPESPPTPGKRRPPRKPPPVREPEAKPSLEEPPPRGRSPVREPTDNEESDGTERALSRVRGVLTLVTTDGRPGSSRPDP
jgi:hypothetical protein